VAAAAVVRLHAEDRAVVASATQEIGNGIYTLMTQVAADALKMPPRLFTVETTPRTRPLHTWDKSVLDGLVNANKQVRISGWLMYDFQHVPEIGTERATVWEVHPITRIEVADGNGGWQDIEQKPN
jgi:hypothetical protein